MSEAKQDHHDDHHDDHMKVYWLVFVGLLIGTVITVLASKIKLGGYMDVTLALAIAICKASLVLIFFMHLREAARIVKLVAAGTFLWLIILLAYPVVDIASRYWVSVDPGWLNPHAELSGPADTE